MAIATIEKEENGITYFRLSNKPELMCKIDSSNFYLLLTGSWYIHKSTKKQMNRHYIRMSKNAEKKTRHLHREVLLAGDYNINSIVDHIDLDGLNNTLENLRIVDIKESSSNTSRKTGLRYKSISVSFNKKRAHYQCYDGKKFVGQDKSYENLKTKIDLYLDSKNSL